MKRYLVMNCPPEHAYGVLRSLEESGFTILSGGVGMIKQGREFVNSFAVLAWIWDVEPQTPIEAEIESRAQSKIVPVNGNTLPFPKPKGN